MTSFIIFLCIFVQDILAEGNISINDNTTLHLRTLDLRIQGGHLLDDIWRKKQKMDEDKNQKKNDHYVDFQLNVRVFENPGPPPLDWKKYPSLGEVSGYLKSLAAAYSYVTFTTIGQSSHLNEINMVTIGVETAGSRILVEAGMHGRDWAGVISLLYFIDSIARNFTQQPHYISSRNWYFIPILNPDGYIHSRLSDPKWKKNRRKVESAKCLGVYLNKNFAQEEWCTIPYSLPCSPRYCGPMPFSEEESQTLRKIAFKIKAKAYLSIQSEGSVVIFPKSLQGSRDWSTQVRFAEEIARAMRKIGDNNYVFRQVEQLGTSIGWMYINNMLHSYILKSRDGFNLVAQEVQAGIIRFSQMYSDSES